MTRMIFLAVPRDFVVTTPSTPYCRLYWIVDDYGVKRLRVR